MGTVWLNGIRVAKEPRAFPLPDRAMWALVAMAESQYAGPDGGFLTRDDGRMAVRVQGGRVWWEVRGDDLDLLLANGWVVVRGEGCDETDQIDVTEQGLHWVGRFVADRGKPVWVVGESQGVAG